MYLLKQCPRLTSLYVTETAPRPCLALERIKFEAQRHSKRCSLNSNEYSHFSHISRVHLNFHCSLRSKSCTSSRWVPAVQLKAWMMRKGSNAKKQATPFESKFEAQLEHRDGAWRRIEIRRPSFAIELWLKFKWGVRVVVVPLTRDKRDY